MKLKYKLDPLGGSSIFHSIIVVLFLVLTTGCATVTKDIEVVAAAAPNANISAYKTYDWLGSVRIINDPEGKWEPPGFDADAEVKWLIDREFRQRGMIEVTANPDVSVGFAAGIDMEELQLIKNPETNITTLKNIPVGSLKVVLVDSSTTIPVWLGVASVEIQEEPSIKVVRKRLGYAVRKIFKLLPR
jgi:hypothetical protein